MKVQQSEPMDLLDRYLQAVRLFVPRRHYDDIVAEVSTNLVHADGGSQEGARPTIKR